MTDLNLDYRPYSTGGALRRPGIAGAVVSAVVSMLANAQLARATKRHQSRGSPPVSAHLRRDLGLPPEGTQWWRAIDRW